ncbi:MAG: hypothetical protein U0572_06990 [Phycisphaerales bacterium]
MNAFRAVFPLLVGYAVCVTACSKSVSQAPSVLALTRAQYEQAFDAAVELASDEGLPTELRDRDGGVIETRPNVAGSVLEPWDWHQGLEGAVESTITFQRRRARFEFVPAGFRPTAIPEDAPLEGRRTPGSVPSDANGAVDMRTYDGPIELRVWVFLERAFVPGLQRSPWTFTQTSVSTDALKERSTDDRTTRNRSIWTPVQRDEQMEREILEKLKARITPPAAAS